MSVNVGRTVWLHYLTSTRFLAGTVALATSMNASDTCSPHNAVYGIWQMCRSVVETKQADALNVGKVEEEEEDELTPEERPEQFDSACISTAVSPFVWDTVMKATAAAMDSTAIKLERTKRKRKMLLKRREQEAMQAHKSALTLDKSMAKVGRALRVITLEGFKELMREVDSDLYEARVWYTYRSRVGCPPFSEGKK